MRTLTLAGSAVALVTTFFLSSAKADNEAYMSDRSGVFGSLDLNTGLFTSIGNMRVTMTGMALDSGTLYGGQYPTGNLCTINPTTGSVTLVGSSSESYELFGATSAGLFALGAGLGLYPINAATGSAVWWRRPLLERELVWNVKRFVRFVFLRRPGPLLAGVRPRAWDLWSGTWEARKWGRC